jgi:hypothetical protein
MAKGLFDLSDIDDYRNRLTDEQKKSLIRHCNRYEINPKLIAWYDNWEDFCSDWCDEIGYTRTEARERLRSGDGEFKVFSNGEIIRLSV